MFNPPISVCSIITLFYYVVDFMLILEENRNKVKTSVLLINVYSCSTNSISAAKVMSGIHVAFFPELR